MPFTSREGWGSGDVKEHMVWEFDIWPLWGHGKGNGEGKGKREKMWLLAQLAPPAALSRNRPLRLE